jgi:hypothetical protein
VRRLATLVLVLLVPVVVAGPAEAVARCPGFGAAHAVGTVAADGLTEISGVAASRTHPGVWWVHDDSGGGPEVSAIGEHGEDLGTYRLAGAEAFDWEDIAAAEGQLYLADIGDNGRQRKDPRVFRVAEPAAPPTGAGGRLTGVATIHLAYPDGPVDAEALLVDPRSGDLFVLTKEVGVSRVFRASAASLVDGGHVRLEQVARLRVPEPRSTAFGLSGSLVTGADASPDGSTVLVRTYRSVLAFARPAGRPLADAFASPPCEAPQAEEPQGEAVGWAADGRSYVTLSEGEHVPVHRVDVQAATAGPAASTWPVAALLGGVAALAGAVLVASRRRAGRR